MWVQKIRIVGAQTERQDLQGLPTRDHHHVGTAGRLWGVKHLQRSAVTPTDQIPRGQLGSSMKMESGGRVFGLVVVIRMDTLSNGPGVATGQ